MDSPVGEDRKISPIFTLKFKYYGILHPPKRRRIQNDINTTYSLTVINFFIKLL